MNVFTTRTRLESRRPHLGTRDQRSGFLALARARAMAGALPCTLGPTPRRLPLRSRHYDDWTIESWRIEPRLRALDVDIDEPDQNPPLWKDLTLASIVAVALWGAAAMIFA